MTQDIKTLKMLIESAENEGTEIINGVTYPASHTWREIALLFNKFSLIFKATA